MFRFTLFRKIKPLGILMLDLVNDPTSGRHSAKLGDVRTLEKKKKYKLIDKICYPVNLCPFCYSDNTFHHRIQRGGDQVGNVWRNEGIRNDEESTLKKFDLCLDCRREHLIEAFFWKRVK